MNSWDKFQENPTVTYIKVDFGNDEKATLDAAPFMCPRNITKGKSMKKFLRGLDKF